jgi:hypothetical protein
MPRDSNGNYTLPSGNPVVTGTTISSSWGNTTLTDIGTVLTASLDRSGNGSMLAALKILDGTAAAPGVAFGAEPSTGLYRAAANTVGLSIGGTVRYTFTPTALTLSGQNVVLNAPASGTTLVLDQIGSGASAALLLNVINNSNYFEATDGTSILLFEEDGSHNHLIGTSTNHALSFFTDNVARIQISAAGNVIVNSSTTGTSLSISGANATFPTLNVGIGGSSSVTVEAAGSVGVYSFYAVSSASQILGLALVTNAKNYNFIVGNSVANALSICDNGVDRLRILSTGGVVLTGDSTVATLSVVAGAGGVHPLITQDEAGNGPFNVGYLEVPMILKNASYGYVLSDSGKSLVCTGAAPFTWTIPANASVAYPVGTTLSGTHLGSGSITVAITTDTLVWLGTGGTGSRTLSPNGKFTATKVAATEWTISGINLS